MGRGDVAALIMLALAGCQFRSNGTVDDDALDDALDVASDDALPPLPDADPTAPDAAPGVPDARFVFDPARDCPADYAPQLLGGSRYRYMDPLATPMTFAAAAEACAADAPGWTHLAVPDDPNHDEIKRWTDVLGTAEYLWRWTWIGVTREAGSTQWVDVLGRPVDVDPLPLANNEPSLAEAQAAALWINPTTDKVLDDPPFYGYLAVCECDGNPPAQ